MPTKVGAIQLDNDGNIRQKKNLDGLQPSFYGAQRQNRTVDTGIFSRPGCTRTLKTYHAYCGVYWPLKILHLDGPSFTTDDFNTVSEWHWVLSLLTSCPQILESHFLCSIYLLLDRTPSSIKRRTHTGVTSESYYIEIPKPLGSCLRGRPLLIGSSGISLILTSARN